MPKLASTSYSPDPQSIRTSMQASPNGCSPTERRVNYLVKAKQARMEKRASQSRFHQSSIKGEDWVAGASISPPPTNRGRNEAVLYGGSSIQEGSEPRHQSSFKKRNMTYDAGDSRYGHHMESIQQF